MNAQSFGVSLVTAVYLTLAMGTGQAQTTANGPYYATPSWDQKLQCDTALSCPRFIVLSNWNSDAVLDRESGLVWQRMPIGPSSANSQTDAVKACWGATTGGRAGWRLPRAEELMSLADPSNSANSSLPPGNPFLGVFYGSLFVPGMGLVPNTDGAFWASDISPPGNSFAAIVDFQNARGAGGLVSVANVVSGLASAAISGVWCVRSGGGTSVQ